MNRPVILLMSLVFAPLQAEATDSFTALFGLGPTYTVGDRILWQCGFNPSLATIERVTEAGRIRARFDDKINQSVCGHRLVHHAQYGHPYVPVGEYSTFLGLGQTFRLGDRIEIEIGYSLYEGVIEDLTQSGHVKIRFDVRYMRNGSFGDDYFDINRLSLLEPASTQVSKTAPPEKDPSVAQSANLDQAKRVHGGPGEYYDPDLAKLHAR